MKNLLLSLFIACFSMCFSSQKEAVLYSSLDPTSLNQQYAFYKLYGNSDYGQKALNNVWKLLTAHHIDSQHPLETITLPVLDLEPLIHMVNEKPYQKTEDLSKDQLTLIEKLGSHLCHKKLKGHKALKKEELFDLDPKEIDLSRALLIYEYENLDHPQNNILQYEANLDLMALQILARLPKDASDHQKIDTISSFIFHEMKFRFPPHSLWAQDVDLYTFLPSVLDSRQGVCLGVSIIYLSLAQRLGIDLEIVTPPGHIYIRYNDGKKITNIETTARGIHMPCENYLGINTRSLQLRNIKEVIGMAFINKAAVMWHRNEYDKSIELYEKALPYLKDDPQLKMFLGLNYYLNGKEEKGFDLLKQIVGKPFPDSVYEETLIADVLQRKANKKALEAIFMQVDETKASILEKQKTLNTVLKACPKFRAGILQLAVTHLQLGRSQEALETLKRYHALDPIDPTVNYYLTMLCLKRFLFAKAWLHYKMTKKVLTDREHMPKPLKGLEYELRHLYPEKTY